jgi:excisionase family DNA binding protein
MAGRFLSLEEAARRLGVTADEVNRLVDRKKLFPMRDGATVKFRSDDVERVAQDLGDDLSQSEDLSLDLDLPALASPGGAAANDDEIVLGEPIEAADFAIGDDGDAGGTISRTILRTEPGPGLDSDPAAPAAASVFDDLGGDGDAELSLEPLDSIVGASSPSLSRQSRPPSTGVGPAPGDSLAINLSNISGAAAGSAPGLSSEDATMMLSGSIDSGLSLEGEGASVVSGEASVVYPAESSGMFGGDEFLLGGETNEEESASVVIPTEETGDSSFFGAAIEGEGSQFNAESSVADSGSVIVGPGPEFTIDTPFSGLQITGLICCSLLMLGGGFVVFDLVRTLGSSEGPMLANPVLDRIAETFGWR